VDVLTEPQAQVVVISAVSPPSFLPLRYLYKRIRRRHPKVAIVIGLWGAASSRRASRCAERPMRMSGS